MNYQEMQTRGYRLDQISLKHNMGQVASRSECDICVKSSIGYRNGLIHSSPVILSNMPCTQNDAVLNIFRSKGWAYVLHRVQNSEDMRKASYFYGYRTFEYVRYCKENPIGLKSISIGVQQEDMELLKSIKNCFGDECLDWLTVDVAFIYNQKHKEFLREVRRLFPNVYLIAGNFTTPDAVKWLYNLGVDAGKFGISTSLLCRTGAYTGFSSCATDFLDCAETASYFPHTFQLIHDGGVGVLNENTGECATGDIFKMLNFGASFVMSSSLFRWCSELADDGGNILQYGNSTSEVKKHSRNVEGAVKTFKTNGMSIRTQMEKITENLQSSMSYAGLKTLDSAYLSCKWNVL